MRYCTVLVFLLLAALTLPNCGGSDNSSNDTTTVADSTAPGDSTVANDTTLVPDVTNATDSNVTNDTSPAVDLFSPADVVADTSTSDTADECVLLGNWTWNNGTFTGTLEFKGDGTMLVVVKTTPTTELPLTFNYSFDGTTVTVTGDAGNVCKQEDVGTYKLNFAGDCKSFTASDAVDPCMIRKSQLATLAATRKP